MSTIEYSLGPSFDCPFGWPAEPSYPIDPINQTTATAIPHHLASSPERPSRKTPSDLLQTWDSIFSCRSTDHDEPIDQLATLLNRLYLEAVYLPETSAVERFAARVRNSEEGFEEEALLGLYESFMIPEEALARKWGTEMGKIARVYEARSKRVVDGDEEQEEEEDEEEEAIVVENDEELFHLNEPEAFALVLQQFFSPAQPDLSRPLAGPHPVPDSTKVSFIKPDSIAQQLEVWSTRETQLQIVLLLELIILTNLSLDAGSQLLHKKQLSASPRKKGKEKRNLGGLGEEEEKELEDKEVVADLECLLEGLVDKLAMWQIISGLENHLGPSRKSNPRNDSLIPSSDTLDLDDVQRFWTDVVEEHYTRHLPLLNPSFRPKLFPTSIYDPSASSSLVPTQFDATARPGPGTIHRTPNLKKLERRAAARAGRQETAQMRQNVSPTMLELTGLGRRRPLARPGSLSESQLALQARSSRALFNRRQVTMSKTSAHLPKPRPILNSSSVGPLHRPAQPRSLSHSHLAGSKRKQSSPKHKSTALSINQLSTPRKSAKSSSTGFASRSATVLVPDTPQNNHRLRR
ncbi:hypothetical protein PGT21_031025 [Puccinia graminis f. sp. tritici]|uniref:DNA replication regulator Sld3 C-terminal domain-containing protein n=1 Tax=Puccinia graminis f. sp. tritici TaxID=56615 RepID=A0A5B0NAH3_PUCGR|nr:hypothetical protein PGT21_031025 [Puccinia graminis f. sp. tritici]KAA1086285.1 hypothetical protein PGTUg99_003194 [Puccinia graminis f. sp. tritici]